MSRCLTKNYCSKECFAADEAVHVVCCKKKQEVDKRKVKIGGKAKAGVVNQNLQEFQVSTQLLQRRDQQTDDWHSFQNQGVESEGWSEGGKDARRGLGHRHNWKEFF